MATTYRAYHVVMKMATDSDRAASVSNSFNFTWQSPDSSTPSGTDLTNLYNICVAFYNAISGSQTNALCKYISREVSRELDSSEYALYDVTGETTTPGSTVPAGTRVGSPVDVRSWTLADSPSTAGLPAQVSSVLAYRASYGSDPEFGTTTRPRASDRGRLYLGPLCIATIQDSSDTPPKCIFTTAFISDCAWALSSIYTATIPGDEDSPWSWCVWSRKEALMKDTAEISADLVPDTQRRRADARSLLVWSSLVVTP